jgi:beta-lactamase regulating signal transducer with metallopeptidase domain
MWQGVLLAGVATISSRMTRRLGAAARYRLWWGTLLGVLGLPAVSSVLRDSGTPAAAAADVSAPVLGVPVLLDAAAPALAAFWICWTALALVRLAAGVVLLRRIKRSCVRFPADREARLTRWRAFAGAGRRATLAVSPVVGSAAVLGGRAPVIAVSSALLERFTDRELDQILLHEWAHVQRRDDAAQLIQQIISAVCGLHPAVWWCARQLQLERELACDEWVVGTTGSARAYAACLVKFPVTAPAAIAPAQLTTRITRLVQPRRPYSAPGSAATAGLAALSVAGSLGLAASVPLVGTLSPQLDAMPAPRLASLDAAERDDRQTTLLAAPPARSRAASAGRPRSRAERAVVPAPLVVSTAAGALDVTQTAPTVGRGVRAAFPSGGYLDSLGRDAALAVLPGESVRIAAPPTPPEGQRATPWSAAADGGAAIGRGSTKAARATAGFFTRIGKSIAGGM